MYGKPAMINNPIGLSSHGFGECHNRPYVAYLGNRALILEKIFIYLVFTTVRDTRLE
jgi:hypothetical protein